MRVEFLQTLRKLHESSDRIEDFCLYIMPYSTISVVGSEQENCGYAM